MIEDTDIGPENSSISQRTLSNHLKTVALSVILRKTNWLMLLYIIIYLAVKAHRDIFLDFYVMIVFLLGSVLVHVLVELFIFFRLKGLEKIWNHKKVQKLKKNALRQRRFHERSS